MKTTKTPRLVTTTFDSSKEEDLQALVRTSIDADKAGDLPFILDCHHHPATDTEPGYWHLRCLFPSFGDALDFRRADDPTPISSGEALAILRSMTATYLLAIDRIGLDEAHTLLGSFEEQSAREAQDVPRTHD